MLLLGLLGLLQTGARTTPLSTTWMLSAALLVVVLLAAAYVLLLALRRGFGHGPSPADESASTKSLTDNPTAFMTASMQAVIQKLRDQEKELAALQRRDRERAQQTERLSEAVTRNMPAGLLLISSPGLITSANPAAETALGVHALVYRRYAEVFGKESALTKLLANCLADGRTFRREEIEYTTPTGELRRL